MDTPPEAVSAAVAATVRKLVHDSGTSINALAKTTGIARVTLVRRLDTGKGWTVAEVASVAAAVGSTYVEVAVEALAS